MKIAVSVTAGCLAALAGAAVFADIVRYPLSGGSTFPIARAVEVPAGTTLIYHSGLTPRPSNPDADADSREYYGDTRMQALSVFALMEESLTEIGCDFGDIVKMTVFLVGDPLNEGRMDFAGFMEAYSMYFGTEEQPNLPARSALQVAGLANPAYLVEVEVVIAIQR